MPKNLQDETQEVKISYRGPFIYGLFYIISLIFLGIILEEIVSNGWLIKKISLTKFSQTLNINKSLKKMKSWWDKEDY
jgi:hypothetical protein